MPDAIEKEQEVDLDLPTEKKRIVNISNEEEDFPEIPEELKNLNMENLAKDEEDVKIEEKPKAVPTRPTQPTTPQRPATAARPQRPAGARPGAGGISRDAIRRSVGIRRPAGEAPTPNKNTGAEGQARPTRRPTPPQTEE